MVFFFGKVMGRIIIVTIKHFGMEKLDIFHYIFIIIIIMIVKTVHF